MPREKFKSLMLFTLIIVMGAFTCSPASGTVEWSIFKTLQLEAIPIDMAVSADGKRFFVLTDQGQVVIYSSTAKMEAEIDVGQHVDQIKLGPKGARLILSSAENKTIKIISLDFIPDINTDGSPYKSPPNAPLVVAVFSDFE
jgi:hypothetical protein